MAPALNRGLANLGITLLIRHLEDGGISVLYRSGRRPTLYTYFLTLEDTPNSLEASNPVIFPLIQTTYEY